MLAHEKQIVEYEKTLSQLKKQGSDSDLLSQAEIDKLEMKLLLLKKKVYSELTPWERVAICRHPARPRSVDYLKGCCEDFTELSGDRLFRDDKAIITGLGRIGGVKFMIIAQEKGCDTESRLERNFGMPHPEGYRKALRCMELAARFHLPVLCLLDTPGAYPGLGAEERGQGWAIARNLFEMSRLRTPIIAVLIGEGASGGALGIGVADVIGMLEHSYYSVISPEGCASILWKDTAKNEIASKALKMNVEDLLELGLVDQMIEEPLGGAHHDPQAVFQSVKQFVLEQWDSLSQIPYDRLVAQRYRKFRRMGRYVIEDNHNQ